MATDPKEAVSFVRKKGVTISQIPTQPYLCILKVKDFSDFVKGLRRNDLFREMNGKKFWV